MASSSSPAVVVSSGSAPNYNQLLLTLEQAESGLSPDDGLLESLKDRFDSGRLPATAEGQLEFAQALVRSRELVDIFRGVRIYGQAGLLSSADHLYAYALGLFRLGEHAKGLAQVDAVLQLDGEHYRALVLKKLLTIRVDEQKVRKLLVYIDGGSGGVRALLTAVQLARPDDVVVLLSVWESAEAMIGVDAESSDFQTVEERKRDVLARFQAEAAAHCRDCGVNYSSVCAFGGARDAIVEQIERHAVDVLVVGQDVNANIFFKLTATTVADQCVAHAPCQVVVAKDVVGARRAAIRTDAELQKLNPLADKRPAPPRRAHTQESAPLAAPPEPDIVDQLAQSFNSVVSYFSTAMAPAAADAEPATSQPGLAPPAEPAPPPPPPDATDANPFRRSFDYLKNRLSVAPVKKQEAEWNGD